MNLFGRVDESEDDPLVLSEATISADPQTLRKLSAFLLFCADEMEAQDDWEHEHYSSYIGEDVRVDLVVFRP